MKHFGGAVAVIAAGLMGVTGCGVVPQTAATTTSSSSETTALPPLLSAANQCMVGHLLADDGSSMTIDTAGKDDFEGDDVEDVGCVLGKLGAPDYVSEHISSTRALDGQQTDEWDDVEARWTYHPDDGLKITFIDRS